MASTLSQEERIDRLEDALKAYVLVDHPNPVSLTNNPLNAPHGQVVLDFVQAITRERS
ncbi:MAG: hypothetical protein ABR972_13185 [Acidimicrobiales bacterium]|jgi:hypothetical protein